MIPGMLCPPFSLIFRCCHNLNFCGLKNFPFLCRFKTYQKLSFVVLFVSFCIAKVRKIFLTTKKFVRNFTQKKYMISQRIKQIIDNENLSIRKFEEKISCTQGIITKCIRANTDISSKVISSIIRNFPQYSALWLLTGEGEMLVSKDGVSDCKQEMKETPVNTLGLKEFIEEKDTAFFQRLAKLEERESSRDFILRDIADTLKEIKRDLKELHKVSTDTTMCG